MRVALVSCVKSKRSEPSAARDLYVSALFQKSRAWAARHCDRWYVLSAEHGLLSPDQRVAPYEKTLDRASRKERRALAEKFIDSWVTSGCWGRAFPSFGPWEPTKRDLAELLCDHDQEDPLEGLSFGRRLQWLGRTGA